MFEIVKSTLLRKFVELEQGDMNVLEYARRFEELARYGYATVDTNIKRNEKFIRGMKPELTRAMLLHIRDPCDVVVEMALRNEEMLAFLERNKAKEVQVGQSQKRKFFHKKGAHKGGAAKKGKAEVVCYKCDKKGHFANECRSGDGKKVIGKKNIKCFNCDQIGHYKNQCKEPAKDGKGKVYALEPATSRPTAEEKGKDVLGGTLLIHSMPVSILFDTGESHSFISHCLVDKLNLEPTYLVTSL